MLGVNNYEAHTDSQSEVTLESTKNHEASTDEQSGEHQGSTSNHEDSTDKQSRETLSSTDENIVASTIESEKLTKLTCCGELIVELLDKNCIECGPRLREQELEYSLVGSDVKALFPSITSKHTGEIIRRRVQNTTLRMEGFDVEKGLAYIAMNSHLTGELENLKHVIPERKNKSNVELKMSAIKASWDPRDKYVFREQELSEKELVQVQASVIEIATRTLFENHTYRFGEQTYRQASGGSIGDRWTGAVAEIVMQDWAEDYRAILENSGLHVPLLAGYVDDGRQCTTTLRPGMRFSKAENRFEYSEEGELEDENKRLAGESKNQRMARICLPAMNSINKDLEFTVESQEEFENEQLPTLDFSLWINEKGELNHTYYQKPMKTPLVLMARSAMSSQQKVQILSNELTRRIFNINQEKNDIEEYKKVINTMTQEMRNSEYNYSTARQVVVSGIRGLRTRLEMRTRKGQEKYRLGATTVKARERKKLLARESWYKDEEKNTECENNQKKGKNKNKMRTNEYPVVSVMFVPYTPGGVLAKKT